MKRKTITLTICLLTCLALIGVGFSAWVITNTSEEQIEGSIEVDVVKDETLSVENSWLNDDSMFNFGEGGATNVAGDWLTVSDDAIVKDFDLTLVVKVKDANGLPCAANITPTITGDENFNNYKNIAMGEEGQSVSLVTDPACAVVEAKDENGEVIVGTYHINITINWGEAFPNGPLAYYNALAYSDANVKDAKNKLDALHNLNETKFDLKVVVSPIGGTNTPNE